MGRRFLGREDEATDESMFPEEAAANLDLGHWNIAANPKARFTCSHSRKNVADETGGYSSPLSPDADAESLNVVTLVVGSVKAPAGNVTIAISRDNSNSPWLTNVHPNFSLGPRGKPP